MNIFVCVVCVVLMVFGVTELVRVLVFWWQKPLTRRPFTLVLPLESAEECECAVRAAAERIRWLDLNGPCRLVCVNLSGDPEIDSICRFLRLRYPYLGVCKKEDLVYHCLSEKDGKTEGTE